MSWIDEANAVARNRTRIGLRADLGRIRPRVKVQTTIRNCIAIVHTLFLLIVSTIGLRMSFKIHGNERSDV